MESPVGLGTEDVRRYLEPRTLARLAGLDLRARAIVEGLISGMHRSPFRGFSVEFAEHRQYTRSDDLKYLDWKVFARSDKLYVKQYEEETNLICQLVVDASESMSYRSDDAGLSKYEYGTMLAAVLAYMALRQQDAVGLVKFHEGIARMLRPSNNPAQWKTLVHELEEPLGPKKTSVRDVLDDLAERFPLRSLVVVISDLFDDPAGIIHGLRKLCFRKHEIIVMHVMDHEELNFGFRGSVLFEGLEERGKLFSDAGRLREKYLAELHDFLEEIRRACRTLQIDYALFDTSAPIDVAISTLLATRSARIK